MTVLLGEHRLERCLARPTASSRSTRDGSLYDGAPDGLRRGGTAIGAGAGHPGDALFELAGIDASPVSVKQARAHLGAPADRSAPAPERPPPARRRKGEGAGARAAAALRVELRRRRRGHARSCAGSTSRSSRASGSR